MRISTRVAALGVFALAPLGCAQALGIQDVSASAAAQQCVDSANQLRQKMALPAVARWTDEEPCADETALAFAGGATQDPACAANLFPIETSSDPAPDVETMLQQAVSEASASGALAIPSLAGVACGYGVSGSTAAGVLLFNVP